MAHEHDIRLSKTLSYWLRHRPDAGGLTLDSHGWADVAAVLAALGRRRLPSDFAQLQAAVASNAKQRFELSPDATRIRARQGHSVGIAHHWPAATPPDLLYHGTVERFLPAIRAEGLKPMRRHHVHLSPDPDTARQVGARRGSPVILSVRAAAMAMQGHVFFLTGNGVWLTDHVPPAFLEVLP